MKQNGVSYKLPSNTEVANNQLEMEHDVKENIESLFEKTGEYLETRIDLYKLRTIDATTDVLSSVISKGIVFLVFVMFTMLLNIGIAVLLGELMGKIYYGFFALAGFYLIAGLVIYSMRKKWFQQPLADKLIKSFLKKRS